MSTSVYSVKEIANWILDFAESKGFSISNMALNKLIYFAYEHFLTKAGRKLTKAKIEAWDHGPVFREVYSSFKQFGSTAISGRAMRYDSGTNSLEIVKPAIALADEMLLIEVLEPLVHLPAYILREISHDSRGAWAKVWAHTATSNPGMEITDDIILSSHSVTSNLQ